MRAYFLTLGWDRNDRGRLPGSLVGQEMVAILIRSQGPLVRPSPMSPGRALAEVERYDRRVHDLAWMSLVDDLRGLICGSGTLGSHTSRALKSEATNIRPIKPEPWLLEATIDQDDLLAQRSTILAAVEHTSHERRVTR